MGYVLEGWEVLSRTEGSEAIVWLTTPEGRKRADAKAESATAALQKAVQSVVSVPVLVVQQTVLDQGEKSSPVASMVVIVGKPGTIGSATVYSVNVLDASVRAFVDAINAAIMAQSVVMVA